MRVGRALSVLALIGWLAAACSESPRSAPPPTSSPVGTAATSASATPPPRATPRVESPLVVLDVRMGSEPERPGLETPRPPSTLFRGPRSFAVDASGLVWLWDQAKHRAISFDDGRLAKAVDLPYIPVGSDGMLVADGRIYLREGLGEREFEIEIATGAVPRTAEIFRGAAGIYPYDRPSYPEVYFWEKGVPQLLGHDRAGNAYQRHITLNQAECVCGSYIRRVRPDGSIPAVALFAYGSFARDYFVAPDGAVYQLEWLEGGRMYDRVVVTRVMAPGL